MNVEMSPEDIKGIFQEKNDFWNRVKKRIDRDGKVITNKTPSNATPECEEACEKELEAQGWIKHVCDKCKNPTFAETPEEKAYVFTRINELEKILVQQYEKNPSSITGKPPVITDFNKEWKPSNQEPTASSPTAEVIELKKQLDDLAKKYEEFRGFNKTLLSLHEDNKKRIADLEAKVDGLVGSK